MDGDIFFALQGNAIDSLHSHCLCMPENLSPTFILNIAINNSESRAIVYALLALNLL